MSFRVFKILIIFFVLIFLFNRIYKFRQFEHANNTCRIVMTSCVGAQRYNIKILDTLDPDSASRWAAWAWIE